MDRAKRTRSRSSHGTAGGPSQLGEETAIPAKARAAQESERQYRRVVEDQTDFIVRWLPGGIRTFVNDSYCDYFGVSREQAIGSSFFHHIDEAFRRAVQERIDALTPEHPVSTGEHQVIRPDGTIGWNQWTDRAIFNGQGELIEYQSVGRDITDRKRAEEALRDSEQRYRSLTANIPDVVWTSDRQGRTTFISENIARVYGYTSEEICARGEELWLGRIHHDDLERVLAAYHAVFDEGVPLDIEYRIQRKDGAWIWLYDRSFGAYQRNGVAYADGVFQDVTKRKKAEEALKEGESNFRELSNAAFEAIVLSENGRIIEWNEAFLKMFGYRQDEVKGRKAIDFVAPVDRQRVLDRMSACSEGVYDHQGLHQDGTLIDLQVHARTVTRGGRSFRLTAVRDVTKQKQAEIKLKEYQAQLKSLASEVSLAEERERRRIAVGLHDDIAQKLAMVKLSLQTLQATLTDESVVESLAKQSQFLGQVMEEVQSLTFDLSNPVLYQFGLEAAVETYLMERIQGGFEIKCDFSSGESRQRLDENIMVVLFQATRELLANVVKHAHADRVSVRVDSSGDTVRVTVEDNGIGIDACVGPYRSAKGGFGLFNVRERLEYLGGTLVIDSGASQGTRVLMTAPRAATSG